MRPIKPRLVERRQAERRRAVAAARAPAQEESWFGAVGVSTAVRDDAWNDEAESRFERGWHGPGEDAPADSRFLSRQAQRIVRSGVSAFERLYIAFLAARVALGLALLVAQIVAAVFGGRPALPIELVCGL